MDAAINEWSAELERRSRAFAASADALAAWDAAVLAARASLVDQEERVARAAAAVSALDRRLGLLEAHQKEIHDALASVEAAAAAAYADDAPALDREAAEWDGLYARVDAVAASLARAGDDLRSAIDAVNAGAAPPSSSTHSASASDAAAKLVRVLNNQLHALADADDRCDALEARLRSLGGGGRVA